MPFSRAYLARDISLCAPSFLLITRLPHSWRLSSLFSGRRRGKRGMSVARAASSSTPGLTDSSGASNNVASQAFRVPHPPLGFGHPPPPPPHPSPPSLSSLVGVDGGGRRGCDGWRDKAGKTDGVKNEARARVDGDGARWVQVKM